MGQQSDSATSTMPPDLRGRLRDFASLAKPRVTSMVLVTAAGGAWLAPGEMSFATWMAALLGTVLVVASANALNCYLERDSDRHMARTKNRPLPDGRMPASHALVFGLTLALVSIPMLWFLVNPVTGMLATIALVSYVWVYTPMKAISPRALVVGAVPGAMPPLMGWTAVTGRLDWSGLALFGILFIWQLPHFIAISVYRVREYDKAGIATVPGLRGMEAARAQIFWWTACLVPVSLMLVPLGVAGWIYLAVAAALGLVFLAWALRGYVTVNQGKWARGLFLYSLVYLTLLFTALVIDAGPAFAG